MDLAQTLAGNWVITVANPEEGCSELQLAEFEMGNVGTGSPAEKALVAATAAAYAALLEALAPRPWRVASHDPAARAAMAEAVEAARRRLVADRVP